MPTVLVVDDETNLLDLVKGYLEREGFVVTTASDGPAAVDVARALRPDLVVLDLMLPGFDGLEVCRRLRQFTDAYVLMLTARTDEVDRIVGLEVGATVSTGEGADILPGNALQFKHIPPGTMVHNLELYPGRGGQVVRSAGGSAQLLSKENDVALVKLPSGEVRKFSIECMATVGQVGNLDHENETFGKAGRTRWRGIKPTVRGVAMNPVDHPHGGGEGRVKGNHPQTPWAFPTLGKKTRNNKRTDRNIVERRK